eukprot:15485782-Alexandrium_andersonii.AAC.1
MKVWRSLARGTNSRKAMTLYYKLKGKAWDDAEELDVEKLGQEDTALEYFEEWIRERYLDMEITKVGK